MKLKRILCMLVTVLLLSGTAVYTAFAEESKIDSSNDPIAALELENPCEVDENGNITLENGVLIDLILPEVLGGQELTSISAKSFAGCPYIRSVVVPETILEIWENAFVNCEFLETIYVIGHNEDDLTLGANWNGDAEVLYVVDEMEEKEVPTAEDTNRAGEKTPEDTNKEDTPSEADMRDPVDSESADSTKENADTEKKAPTGENGSDEEKQTDSEQPGNNEEDSAPSEDAVATNPQDNEGMSFEENTTEDTASAEVNEITEN